MTPKQALELAKENNAVMVDFRFIDWPGTWQHCTFPIGEVEESTFEDGMGFDGSSIRGWQAIHESDMLMVPDASTAFMDPFFAHPTLVLICDIVDPITHQPYHRDPRHIARKAEAYLKQTGIGDTVYFGPEAEFFVFNDARFSTGANHGFFEVDSVEGAWNTGREEEGGNLAFKPRHKQGYFPVPPTDSLQDLRTEMVLTMQQVGLHVEAQHHEVATAGQCEIDMRFETMLDMADRLTKFKYVVKQVARQNGVTATFMPKPLFDDNGSGMHCHQSIWKEGTPLFAGDGYAGLSDLGLWYVGGILKHSRSLAAFTNPTTNSYKRLVPGFEAPVNLALSARNRSASCRIPMYSASPKAKRVEVRYPDPTANPYLAFSAMLMAGLDGIENKIDPGEPLEKDIYAMAPEELAAIPTMPASLEEALDELEENHDFLLKGDVFTDDSVRNWIEYKRENEVDPMRLRPHPHEFELYFDM
ncbi:MAG: type I glutamate--ammonia ligase [Deltaproteobacteria bacterium]|nr:type I glutamate--ammonia ligase [Deltaproteobacteria bacterium]MBW2394492.1 type I glutamate--ammonia ligase [Deltaproteobacteria bacterium]